MKKLLLAGICFSFSLTGLAVTVTVTSPTNNQQVSSPVHLVASATGNYQITGWVVYLDGNIAYTAGATKSIDTSINASNGNHQLVFRAWDQTGAYGSVYEQITVSGGGGGGGDGLPTPPPGAIVYDNIDEAGGWRSCHDPGCAGGSGQGTYWMAQHQSSPSRDGSSMEFFNSGSWANALWWHTVGANNGVRNFLWEFYFYVDSTKSAQALEFDAFQFVNGYNYMIGSQCVVPAGVWDTWDEASGHWSHTGIPCNNLTPGTWHHVQWYMTTNPNAHQYTYVTLVVDGKSNPVKITRNAKYLGWANNIGVQWQLDVNSSGQGYHEWVDSAKLTIW